jgi:hypothetical protein
MTNPVRDLEERTAAWLAELESGGPWWDVATRYEGEDGELRLSAIAPYDAAREAARRIAEARGLAVAGGLRTEHARLVNDRAEFAYVTTLGEPAGDRTYLVRGELRIWVRPARKEESNAK